jgi:hypothetical protein
MVQIFAYINCFDLPRCITTYGKNRICVLEKREEIHLILCLVLKFRQHRYPHIFYIHLNSPAPLLLLSRVTLGIEAGAIQGRIEKSPAFTLLCPPRPFSSSLVVIW